jgi:hypothetical protein
MFRVCFSYKFVMNYAFSLKKNTVNNIVFTPDFCIVTFWVPIWNLRGFQTLFFFINIVSCTYFSTHERFNSCFLYFFTKLNRCSLFSTETFPMVFPLSQCLVFGNYCFQISTLVSWQSCLWVYATPTKQCRIPVPSTTASCSGDRSIDFDSLPGTGYL